MKYPKHQYIRSKALLEAARQIPCQWCGADDGTIVAAHSNWGHGKGRGIKANDNQIASLCFSCHTELDQGKWLNKMERMGVWKMAHYRTVDLLNELGLWPEEIPQPKDKT